MKKGKHLAGIISIAMILSCLTTGIASSQSYVPPDEPPYKGIELTVLCDSGHNFIPWVSKTDPELNNVPRIEHLLGVKLNCVAKSPDLFPTIMADLVSGAGHYNIIVYFPPHNGDLMGGDWLVPLNDYIKKYPVFWSDIYPIYRYLYCMWGDKIYALPYDGDVLMLYYRKDLFSDPKIRSKFKEKYGYDLAPPKTYKEYNDIARFFTGWDWDHDGKPNYGTIEDVKDLGYGPWLTRFASTGGVFFDENMNPQINTPGGVQALKDYKVAVECAPPGAMQFGATQVFKSFLDGLTAMTLTWPDIGPWVGTGKYKVKPNQVGFALVPGYVVKGKLIRRAWTGVGRVMAISKLTPPEKREAAFRVIAYMASPAVSLRYTTNGKTGENTFRRSHDMTPALWHDRYPELKDYMKAKMLNTEHGYPDIYLTGEADYINTLTTHIQDYLRGKGTAKEALDATVEDWNRITERIGREKLKKQWAQEIKLFKRLGIWIEE